jgi:hypothetical protein
MSLWVPSERDFLWKLETTTGRPGSNFGVTVTASGSTHTMGSWAQLIAGSSVTEDVWGILININSSFTSATRSDSLLNIGIDESGGTSYTVKIPYLLAGGANTYVLGGLYYYFPIFIKAGSSIGAQIQSVTASRTARVWATLYGCPKHPETARAGSIVTAFGVTTGSSNGTAITAGTTSDGSWTQIGSATTEPHWWWQLGHGYDNSSMAQVAAGWHWDIAHGSAATKITLAQGLLSLTGSTEFITLFPQMNMEREVGVGDIMYVRGQCSGTPPAGTNVALYAVGG